MSRGRSQTQLGGVFIYRFLPSPNLPENKTAVAVISGKKPEIIAELKRLGVRPVLAGELKGITGQEKYHADMMLCHIGSSEIIVSDECKDLMSSLRKACIDYGLRPDITYCDKTITEKEPMLNVCILKNRIICSKKHTYKKLLDTAEKEGLSVLDTAQRYTKCSIAVVSENAVITADTSIYRLCLKNNIDVLKISEYGVELSGYSYGFIGGSCALLDRSTFVFCGNIKNHPDYLNIRDFLRGYGVYAVSLSDKPLYDIGGIIPLIETV